MGCVLTSVVFLVGVSNPRFSTLAVSLNYVAYCFGEAKQAAISFAMYDSDFGELLNDFFYFIRAVS